MCRGKVGFQSRRAAIAGFSFFGPSLGAEDIAEVIVGFREIGPYAQGFPLAGFRRREFTSIHEDQAKVALHLFVAWQQPRGVPHRR